MGEETKSTEELEVPQLKTLTAGEIQEAFQEATNDLDLILEIDAATRHSDRARRAVRESLDRLKGKGVGKDLDKGVLVGAGLYMLGAYVEAHEFLKDSRASIPGAFYLGQTLVELGRPAEGAEILDKTAKRKPQTDAVRFAHAEALLRAGSTTEALKSIREIEKQFGKDARTLALRGSAADIQGHHDEAREIYGKALDEDPENGEALFRLAYNMDLYGDDEEAIELYRRCTEIPRPNVNAFINLGILYEDQNEYDKAIECYQAVLKSYPNHARAQAFLKDSMSSLEEVVDEERDRMEDRRWQTLQIPITDFELSVRSRNCLNKMMIRTLGDLVQKTETELLSYKNFGETSLGEIKVILESKNLRLGVSFSDLRRGERRARLDDLFESGDAIEDFALKPIDQLGLSIRSRKCMEVLDIESIGDLMSLSEKELVACPNFGQTSLLEVKRKLAENGVNLREIDSEVDAKVNIETVEEDAK